jgi:MoxR-like ATPase
VVEKIVDFVNLIRQRQDILKKPGISESIDWATALAKLSVKDLTRDIVQSTLPCIVKTQEDLQRLDIDSMLSMLGGRST